LPQKTVNFIGGRLATQALIGGIVKRLPGEFRRTRFTQNLDFKLGRIVADRVGREGIVIPWYAATRIGSSIEDRYNQKVAELLARWCEVNDGLIGGRDEN
jgi:hypothetical protein